MRRVFCTIITEDYLPFVRTLFQSILKHDIDVKFIALIVDPTGTEYNEEFDLLYPYQLIEKDLISNIQKKYSNNSNALRWSLKSVLMIHLLKTGKYNQVFFVDPDICFYSDFRFLYENLGEAPFLLSPHWGCMDPRVSKLYFSRLLTDGLYNAGFLGATISGLEILFWWANMCLFACDRNKESGIHDDQGYLNLFPLLNPDCKIITHRGCNVAEWNRFENKRSLTEDGTMVLNSRDPLVFIHFSNLGYLVEFDPFLVPFLKRYELELRRNGFEGRLISTAVNFVNRQRLKRLNFFERLIRKILGQERFIKWKKWEI